MKKKKRPRFSDVIESYLDPFESMQKATEIVVGNNTIAEAVDDEIESLLMLSKMPAVDKIMEKQPMKKAMKEKRMRKKAWKRQQRKKEWK
jgi:hypothetical protein